MQKKVSRGLRGRSRGWELVGAASSPRGLSRERFAVPSSQPRVNTGFSRPNFEQPSSINFCIILSWRQASRLRCIMRIWLALVVYILLLHVNRVPICSTHPAARFRRAARGRSEGRRRRLSRRSREGARRHVVQVMSMAKSSCFFFLGRTAPRRLGKFPALLDGGVLCAACKVMEYGTKLSAFPVTG